MKQRTKIVTSIVAVILSCVLLCICILLGNSLHNGTNVSSANPRTIELAQSAVDVQSVFDEFEEASFIREGRTVYFEGIKPLERDSLSELDNISESNFEELENCSTKYNFSYNSETNVVTIKATVRLSNGNIEVDELSGVGFINKNKEIDAVMNIEGEGILLSEMRDAGLIQNCGWFSNFIKKVVKAVVVVAVAAAVVVATVAVSVATAGVAGAALVAAGVGMTTTAITATSAAIGLTAGLLFTSTIGKAALQAGTAVGEELGNGATQLVDKATGAIIAFLWDGIEYIMEKLTDAIRYEMRYGGYRIAKVDKTESCVYVSVTMIGYGIAVNLLTAGLSVYSYNSYGAYEASKAAGGGLIPTYHLPHDIDKKTGNFKKGVFYEHWHVNAHSTNGHAFFGAPVIHY